MASCHPCGISVFYNRLVPNAITVYSHYSLGGKKSQQHEQLNTSFGDLSLNFCEYLLVSFNQLKAV